MGNLTIYLLREEFETAASVIEGLPSERRIESEGAVLGTLYVKEMPEKQPAWTGLFSDFTDVSSFAVRTTSALYVTEAGGRLFALAFGHGRHLMKPGAYEDRFGLLVVINTLKSDQLRSIDKRTFDTVDQNVRAQVSQQSPATEFGIDIEKDLIRGITGQPTDQTLGSRMTGADSLVVSVDVTLPDLSALLERYLAAYGSDAYKDGFEWIDQIHQVADNSPLKAALDEELVRRMNEWRKHRRSEGLWLAIPDVIDYTGLHRFRFTGDTTSHNDLHLPGFIDALKNDESISIELLKRKQAFAVNEEGLEVGEKWPVYKCVHLEVEDQDEGLTYLLAAGKWFCIRKSFSDEINEFYERVPMRNLEWLPYQHDSEGDYNKAVHAASGGLYALMDAVDIPVGGLRDKIEFCDLYSSSSSELIHVKRYGASSLLGHLFNQGLVSGEHLRSDKDFLVKVNDKLPPAHRIAIRDSIPRQVLGFTVIFAIISEFQGEDLHIPFFAKVAFKNVCSRLRSLGYVKIERAKITVDEIFSKTRKPKVKRTRRPQQEPSGLNDGPVVATDAPDLRPPAKKTVYKRRAAPA